jgi:ferric-dicitrate binding protein FerR (iron transport regulator)
MSDAEHRDSDRREQRKRELISQEAAEWLARMQAPRVPLEDRRRFLRWLKQSEVHVAEYLTVASIDGDLRRADVTPVLADDTTSNVVELFAQARAPHEALREGFWSRCRAAAAIAACGLAALLFVATRQVWAQRIERARRADRGGPAGADP